jgi:hypothetical protein
MSRVASTKRRMLWAAVLATAQGLTGCGGFDAPSAPSAPPPAPSPVPQPVPQPSPSQLAVFTDPASGFSTSDVRDAQEQIVQFNYAGELIWAADQTRFPGYPVTGDVIRADPTCRFCLFQVRFGSKDGEPRAYLTWTDDVGHFGPQGPTLLDVDVVRGQLVITGTNVPVPRS